MNNGGRKVPVEKFADGKQPSRVRVDVQFKASSRLNECRLSAILVKEQQTGGFSPREFLGHFAQQPQITFAATTCVRPGLLRSACGAT
ncbi:hypothetical protein BH10PLA2_BH10PLA2_17630 [soil metagenome]